MKAILSFLFSVCSIIVCAQQVIKPIIISLPEKMPANTADWLVAAFPLRITALLPVTNSRVPQNVATSKMIVTIKSNGAVICGNNNIALAPPSKFGRPSMVWGNAEVMAFFTSPCILSSGNYVLCVQFFENKEGTKILLGEACKNFTVEGKPEENNGDAKQKKFVAKLKSDRNFTEIKDFTVTKMDTKSLSEGAVTTANDCIELFYPAEKRKVPDNRPLVFKYYIPPSLLGQNILTIYKVDKETGRDNATQRFNKVFATEVKGNSYTLSVKQMPETGEYYWDITNGKSTACKGSMFSISSSLVALTGFNCDSLLIDSIKCTGTNTNPNLRKVYVTIKNCSSNILDCNNTVNLTHHGFISSNQLLSSPTGIISNISSLPPTVPANTNVSVNFDYVPTTSSSSIWLYDYLSRTSGGGQRVPIVDDANNTNMEACYCSSCDSIQWRCAQPLIMYSNQYNSILIAEKLCINGLTAATPTPIPIKQISAEITGFDFKASDTCMKCQNNNQLYGNYQSFPAPFGNGMLFPSTGFNPTSFISPLPVPAHNPYYGRELIWQSLTSAGAPLNAYVDQFVSLPAFIQNQCCTTKVSIWVRYTVTRADCTVCSIVYKYSITL